VDGNAALQIRQGKGGLPITAVRGADQVEESVILVNGYDRAIAERPADRSKVSGEHSDFAYEW
jgi:hypothetical protein